MPKNKPKQQYEKLKNRNTWEFVCGNCGYWIGIKGEDCPSLLKLHGSFNWTHGNPIQLKDEEADRDYDPLWIAPGIDKKIHNYPFNKIWGHAFQILNCDILRIIGCSLSRNDWSLIDLIFATQAFRGADPYEIHIIDTPTIKNSIKENYSFIKGLRSLNDIDGLEFNSEDFPEDTNWFREWLVRWWSGFELGIPGQKKEEINKVLRGD